MAGDLEEFLKRAAERRAQKQQQAGGAGAKPKPRPKPEYSVAKRERQVRQPVEQAIPVAEIVKTVDPATEKRIRLAKAKQKSDDARERVAQQQRDIHDPVLGKEPSEISIAGGTPAEQVLALIRRPGGMQQAFLLREILERPEDRWS
jgi:hypothetical protein